MAPTIPVPLPLRNALAALALRALDDPGARAALGWLASPAPAPPAAAAAALIAVGLADPPGDRVLALYDAHAAHVREYAARALGAAERFEAVGAVADPIDRALLAAHALWERQLFFEVHEVLEPHWARASGAPREALQGLIQVAVAFHHLAHGNPRGARKLLADGCEKLAEAGGVLARIDAAALVTATAPWMDALAARRPPPAAPAPALPLR